MKSADSGTKGRTATARELALDVLTRVEQDEAYSNLLLNKALQRSALGRQDAALATEIVYGTIQRLNTIDYFLEQFVKGGMRKLQPWVRSLLRLSLYQLHYLQRIPAHAVVSEAVNIAKRKGHQGISGMVNGVLRSVVRQKDQLALPAQLPQAARIALAHSHPEWLVSRWIEQYGAETAERICEADNVPPHASLRANTIKTTRDELVAKLRAEGIDAHASELAPAGVVVERAGNMADNAGFTGGSFSIQDESSMLVAEAVDPQPGMTVLDCCAAPGGKTVHMAEKMGDRGRIVACDVHDHKRKLIEAQAERLGLGSVETITADARELGGKYGPGTFDCVLLDAPCSGLGVIRRKPEIKWSKRPEHIAEICAVQRELLDKVAPLVKPGGTLVYSTCTMERSENEEQVRAFLNAHPEFEPAELPQSLAAVRAKAPAPGLPGAVQLLPHHYGTDGFFIARMRRRA